MLQEEGVGGLPSQRVQGDGAGGKAAAPGWASTGERGETMGGQEQTHDIKIIKLITYSFNHLKN